MNRRSFLKYVGTTAAVVGASALGLDYLLSAPSSSLNRSTSLTSSGLSSSSAVTSSSTLAATQTQTTTAQQSLTLDLGENDLGGYVFHDYNGNGIIDAGEPFVNEVEVIAKGYYSTFTTKPQNGIYTFNNLPRNQYRLYLIHANNIFRYMCRSNAELVDTKQGYTVNFGGRQRLDMALMEGFLTLPFPINTKYEIDRFYDRDPSLIKYLWWNGKSGYDKSLKRGYSPNHSGIDYYMNEGEPLVAQAPGWISHNAVDEGGAFITITHPNGLKTSHGHISKALLKEGDKVLRGQIVALSGKSGRSTEEANYPHDHVVLYYNNHFAIDPYAPEFNLSPQNSGYYDTMSYGSQGFPWIPLPVNEHNPNLYNYWTKRNDPQYAIP